MDQTIDDTLEQALQGIHRALEFRQVLLFCEKQKPKQANAYHNTASLGHKFHRCSNNGHTHQAQTLGQQQHLNLILFVKKKQKTKKTRFTFPCTPQMACCVTNPC